MTETNFMNPVPPQKPKFKIGDTVRNKKNPKDEIDIIGMRGNYYFVDDPGAGEPQYYTFDYVEENFEL